MMENLVTISTGPLVGINLETLVDHTLVLGTTLSTGGCIHIRLNRDPAGMLSVESYNYVEGSDPDEGPEIFLATGDSLLWSGYTWELELRDLELVAFLRGFFRRLGQLHPNLLSLELGFNVCFSSEIASTARVFDHLGEYDQNGFEMCYEALYNTPQVLAPYLNGMYVSSGTGPLHRDSSIWGTGQPSLYGYVYVHGKAYIEPDFFERHFGAKGEGRLKFHLAIVGRVVFVIIGGNWYAKRFDDTSSHGLDRIIMTALVMHHNNVFKPLSGPHAAAELCGGLLGAP